MKNLKKVLALVVAVAMLASFGFTASAANYSDVASTASYADAVNLLSNLGIITGFEDGTFRPTETVTRAQAATMIVRMLGLADGVEQSATSFTDVDANHWASGYVNVAVANGIVNGMGDGTFNPEGEVTYGQIVKMIVCALGYAPVAENNGGYLGGGYIVAGSKAGFTKGVAGTADAAASRATVAQLIYNALEVELMDQTSYSTGIYGDQYEILEGKTILTEYLELEKIEGIVIATPLSDPEVDLEEDATVTIVITKNYTEDEDADLLAEVGETEAFVVAGVDTNALLGYSVVAYVGENEDDDLAVFAIAEKAGKNSVTVVDTELIAEDGFDGETIVYSKSESSKKTTEAAIDNVITFKNADDVEVENNAIVNGFATTVDVVVDAYENLEEISFIDNDGDGDFEFVIATIPADDAIEAVVEETDVEDFVITFTNDEDLVLDYDDETLLITIVKDGEVVEFDAIAEGDVVTVLEPEAKVLTLQVSSVKVEGTVDEVEDDVYTINGKEYKISPLATEVELAAGDEGIFYINAAGKVVETETVSTLEDANYVIAMAKSEEVGSFGDGEYLVKVFTAKGEVETLTIRDKKVTVNGDTKLDADEAYELIDLPVDEAEDGVLAKIEVSAAGELIAYYTADYDEDFAMICDEYATANEKEYNEKRKTYGIVDIDENTLVFNVEESDDDLEDRLTVTTALDLFVDGESYVFTAYGVEDEAAKVLVTIDATTSVNAEAPVMVVTKVSTVTADDEKTVKITGIVAGETVSVIADPEEAAPEVEKGNVILYAMNGGYATDVAVLYSSTMDGDGELGEAEDVLVGEFSDEDVTIHAGLVTAKETKYFEIDGEKFYFADEYNVTTIDYSSAVATVKAGKSSDIRASAVNPVYVFVKTAVDAEDEVTDIVVLKGLDAE